MTETLREKSERTNHNTHTKRSGVTKKHKQLGLYLFDERRRKDILSREISNANLSRLLQHLVHFSREVIQIFTVETDNRKK